VIMGIFRWSLEVLGPFEGEFEAEGAVGGCCRGGFGVGA
jgi:hypothetical protein